MNYLFREQGDHVFSWRKQWLIDNPVRRMMHPPEKILGEIVEPGMTVVDTGCGTGFFTLALARLVGESGRVIAVDLQAEALARIEEKAEMAGVNQIIETWKCESDDIGKLPEVDFALSFYMAHEVPDIDVFFARMAESVKPGGAMLLVEPYFHVSKQNFETEVLAASNAGFEPSGTPSVLFSHAVLMKKA